MSVRVVDAGADPRWDRFVRAHPEATAYHLAAWGEVFSTGFRASPAYLVSEAEGGELRGVMPLVARTGPRRGAILASFPWLLNGGPLAMDEAAELELVQAAIELAEEQERALTFDSPHGGLERKLGELSPVVRMPTWIAELPPGPEQVPDWLAGRSKNLRRGVKRARDRGVTVRLSESEGDLKAFFRLYLRTMRKHRALPRPWKHLSAARRLLGPDVFRLFVVEHDGRTIAGGVFQTLERTMDLFYNSSDDRALDLRPNHALYSEVMSWAAANGIASLDFGGAPPGSSLGKFKQQWGAVEAPRFQYSYSPGAAPGTPGDVNARLMGEQGSDRIDRLWGRTPLALTRLAGAISFRHL